MDILHACFSIAASILLLLITALLYLILKLVVGNSIGNPDYAPVAGTIFEQLFHFNRIYDYHTTQFKNRPTFRILAPGHSQIFTTESRNIEHILKSNFDNYSKGQYNKDVFSDLFGQGIFAVDGDKWRQQRKLASYEFSTRVLRDYSCAVFRRNAAKLVRKLLEFSMAGQFFDIQDVLMKCSLDSIFKVGFGVDLNSLEGTNEEEGSAFIKAFDDSNALTYWRYVDPFWKLKKLLNVGSEATLTNNLQCISHFVHKLINTKRHLLEMQQCSDKEDILSRFLMESKKDTERMNDEYVRDVILNFMIAGKDTTANTLSWFLYNLCKNPFIQERIAQEVRDATDSYKEKKATVDDFMETITEDVLERMHFLHAALTETLRLYPVVPIDGRCAEADDTLPDGFKVKKGDGIYYVAYAMGRMPYIWGDSAEDFRPERWLKDGCFQPESTFKFIAFHAGPRICLGKDFAYRQMKIVAMALLRFFRFKLADETKTVTYKTMFTLHIKGGLQLYAISRTG